MLNYINDDIILYILEYLNHQQLTCLIILNKYYNKLFIEYWSKKDYDIQFIYRNE